MSKGSWGAKDVDPSNCVIMRRVDFFAFRGHRLLVLAGPFTACATVPRLSEQPLYRPDTVSRAGCLNAGRIGVRQCGQAFWREMGETSAKAVERLRVDAPSVRLQERSEPIELIMQAVGFADPSA